MSTEGMASLSLQGQSPSSPLASPLSPSSSSSPITTSSPSSSNPAATSSSSSSKSTRKEPSTSGEPPVQTNSIPFPDLPAPPRLAPSSSNLSLSGSGGDKGGERGGERGGSSSFDLAFDTRSVRSARTLSSASSLNYLDLSRSGSSGGIGGGIGGAWQSMFKQGLEYVFEWNKGSKAQTALGNFLHAGEKVCAVCPTTEDVRGYFLVVVLEGVRDSSKDYILKVAKLTPLPGQTKQSEGKAGCRYACSFQDRDSAFWEQESRLLHVPMGLDSREEDGGSEEENDNPEFLSEVFILQKSLEEILCNVAEDTSSISSEDSLKSTMTQSQTVSIARPLDFYCLEDGKEELVTAAIDLDSYVDVMQKCGELVSGLALVVTPSYFNSDQKGPKPKSGFAGEGWKFAEDIGGIEVFIKEDPPSRMTRVMSRCVIEASPTEIKYLVKQSKNREQFDPMCRGIEVVETIDDNTVVAHFVDTKYFFNRDFCVIRHNYTTPEGSVYLVSNSVKTPQCPPSDYVRGLVIESGFVMEPRGKGSCLMSYVVQVDINLWVPQFVILQVLKAQVVDVVDQIRYYFLTKRHYETTMRKASRSEMEGNS